MGNGEKPAPHHPVPGSMWTEGLSTTDRPQRKKKKKKKRKKKKKKKKKKEKEKKKEKKKKKKKITVRGYPLHDSLPVRMEWEDNSSAVSRLHSAVVVCLSATETEAIPC